VSGFGRVPEQLRKEFDSRDETAARDILTPWDAGLRFEADAMEVRDLKSPYLLVRWTDRWGTRWEHKRGEVGQVRDDEPWTL